MFRHISKSAVKIAAIIVALALVAGSTATAARLITGKDVRNSSLTGADIKNRSLTAKDFKGTVTGARGATGPAGAPGAAGPAGPKGDTGPQGPAGTPDGYTKGEAESAFLAKGGKAADADKLDGVDGDDLVAGDARLAYNAITVPLLVSQAKLLDVGDLGTISAGCGAGASKSMTFTNTSGSTVTLTRSMVADTPATFVSSATVAPGAFSNLSSSVDNYQLTVQLHRGGANALASEDFSTVLITATDNGEGPCRFHAQAIDAERDQTNLVIDG